MENTTRFSKNYTIKNFDSLTTSNQDNQESKVSISQQLKQSSDSCIQELLEFIQNTNHCVISE